MADWHEYMAKCHAISDEGQHDGGHDGDQNDPVFDMDALYVLLLEGNTDRVIDTIASVTGSDPQVKAFASLWKVLDKTCEAERKLVLREPQYMLDCAWRACGKAEIWPNLTPRNTLCGGEELADVMLHGELSDTVTTSAGKRDAQLAAVLASEQKSFLVALTRADECAVMSAVLNDDHVPSDFLYGYVPEWFDRDRDADMERREYAAIGSQGDYAGLESDPRGLIAAARSVLAMKPSNSPKARDAAETLALLASRGIRAADPDCWPFVEEPVSLAERETIQDGKTRQSDVVTLSPSAVDNLWACPVCWMLENRFSGPRMGSVATNFGSLIHTVAQPDLTCRNSTPPSAIWTTSTRSPSKCMPNMSVYAAI